MDWLSSEGLVYFLPKCYVGPIILFDLDHTLIKPKHGKICLGIDDWEWKFPIVNSRICELVKTHRIIIITNQLTRDKLHIEDIKTRIENVIRDLANEYIKLNSVTDIYADFYSKFQIYIATERNRYRKPSPDIWIDFIYNQVPDKSEVIYVGDAAGRIRDKGIKADFSDSDRAFAHNIRLFCRRNNYNIDITFYTPEEYFGYEDNRERVWKSLMPHQFLKDIDAKIRDSGAITYKRIRKLCRGVSMIILIGPPASGKSTLAKRLEDDLDGIRICQDKIKKKSKCISIADEFIDKKPVIIDATNPDHKSRDPYIAIAEKHAKTYIQIQLVTSKELCAHYNNQRKRKVPKVVYNKFYKNLEIDEGTLKYFSTPVFSTQDRLLRFMYITET